MLWYIWKFPEMRYKNYATFCFLFYRECTIDLHELRGGQRHSKCISLNNIKKGRIHLAVTVKNVSEVSCNILSPFIFTKNFQQHFSSPEWGKRVEPKWSVILVSTLLWNYLVKITYELDNIWHVQTWSVKGHSGTHSSCVCICRTNVYHFWTNHWGKLMLNYHYQPHLTARLMLLNCLKKKSSWMKWSR